MIDLCGACQKPVDGHMWLCRGCAEDYGVLGVGGRIVPRADWPAWLRYATSNEQSRRCSERMAEEHCVPLDEWTELRDSAE